MSNVKDFDSFFSEMKREPIQIRLFGELHDIQRPKGDVMLRAMRAARTSGAEENAMEVIDLAKHILGEERFEGWATRLDLEQFLAVISWVVEAVSADGGNPQMAAKGRKR